jgi:hypothetical protein
MGQACIQSSTRPDRGPRHRRTRPGQVAASARASMTAMR